MMKISLAAAILVTSAAAQTPGIIRVVRNGSVRPYIDAKGAVNVVGMSSISGFSETWMLELHDSFGSLEELDKALSNVGQKGTSRSASSDDLLTPSRALIGLYRPGLSYRADQAIQNLPKMRYFDVVIYRVRPGTELEFGKFLRLRGTSQDSVNMDRPDIVYQIISGETAGTYIVLTPLPSLKVMDDGRAATPAYAEGDQAAARKIAADSELIRERLLFRIDPRVSYVSDDFASGDSSFWRGNAK